MSKLEEVKKTFNEAIAGSSWWSRHIGSQFVDYLCLFVAKIVERMAAISSRALQESYLTLATKRTSILAGAETEGYVGRKAAPSKGRALVTNTGTKRVTLPKYSQCVADNQLRYTLMEAIDLMPQESAAVEVQQFEVSKMTYTVDEGKNWLAVAFPQELTKRIHNIIVRVNGEEWTHVFKFRNTDGKSKAYMEYYKPTDQLGVRFGNNNNGRAPATGDVIEFELWLTNGVTTLLDAQPLELIDMGIQSAYKDQLSIKTSTSIIGGAEPEDIESIRNNALYSPIYDEQIAWDSDYMTFVKRNISGVTWLSIWGEAEQEKLTGTPDVRNINTIFICAYSADKTDEILNQEIQVLFAGREGYNERYKLVERKDVPFTVTVKGKLYPSSNPEWATKVLGDALDEKFGKQTSRNERITKNQIWDVIQELNVTLGIKEFEVEVIGILDRIPIDTYHYLDVNASTIQLNFDYS
ncbi:hypothetical protein ACXWHK_003733 [Vibrio alginolyticus]